MVTSPRTRARPGTVFVPGSGPVIGARAGLDVDQLRPASHMSAIDPRRERRANRPTPAFAGHRRTSRTDARRRRVRTALVATVNGVIGRVVAGPRSRSDE